ncbi:MAG: hypothetical protein SLAVMIC_00487 [uncultured marine phage]|uniref:Uncharacterized protein n=1 Tax=uncultured marine phage TaxID=707152 RepID=A0A8D9CF92_9VIRU|nr:MAG: hypothetical protein SLAVMIC_00487 [uncultured marine phage]
MIFRILQTHPFSRNSTVIYFYIEGEGILKTMRVPYLESISPEIIKSYVENNHKYYAHEIDIKNPEDDVLFNRHFKGKEINIEALVREWRLSKLID